jgi:hypothetical protein
VIFGEVVAALSTVDIRDLNAAEASSAHWGHLELALRAEVAA